MTVSFSIFANILLIQKKYITRELSRDLYAVGAVCKNNQIPEIIHNSLRLQNTRWSKVSSFFTLMKSAILYRSALDTSQAKMNSICVKYIADNQVTFGKIHCFVQVSNCHCEALCNEKCRARYLAIIYKFDIISKFNVPGTNYCS